MHLEDFGKIFGLKPNKEKTKVIWFGSKKKCKMKLCEEWNLDWSEDNFKELGITFFIGV
jgi:hypothetical protein